MNACPKCGHSLDKAPYLITLGGRMCWPCAAIVVKPSEFKAEQEAILRRARWKTRKHQPND